MDDSKWIRLIRHLMLAGFSIVTIAAAGIYWLNNPPYATTLFYIGLGVAGVGVAINTVLVIRSHFIRGEK